MIPSFGDPLVTFLIWDTEKEPQIKLSQEIKSNMSMIVFYLLFNHFIRSPKKTALNVLCWDMPCLVKVWIHFFIRDTEGNNKWLGQYPGHKEGIRRPYHNCKCQFHELSNPNPNCTYLTMEDINLAKKRKWDDEDGGIEYYRLIFTDEFKMHLLKRIYLYPAIFLDHTKWYLQSFYIPQVVDSSCTCLNHLEFRWEVEKIET